MPKLLLVALWVPKLPKSVTVFYPDVPRGAVYRCRCLDALLLRQRSSLACAALLLRQREQPGLRRSAAEAAFYPELGKGMTCRAAQSIAVGDSMLCC